MYKDGSKCPICGSGILDEISINEVFEYKGEKCTVPDYVVFRCSVCEEDIVSKQSLKKAEKYLVDFQKKVDGLLTSEKIRKIREKLGLTQRQMGIIFGGGEKSFARYENATLKQSKAMDTLLRVFDEYPFIPTEILSRNTAQIQTSITAKVNYKTLSNNDGYVITGLKKAVGF